MIPVAVRDQQPRQRQVARAGAAAEADVPPQAVRPLLQGGRRRSAWCRALAAARLIPRRAQGSGLDPFFAPAEPVTLELELYIPNSIENDQ